jgi:hypothetical protein
MTPLLLCPPPPFTLLRLSFGFTVWLSTIMRAPRLGDAVAGRAEEEEADVDFVAAVESGVAGTAESLIFRQCE